MLKSLLSLVTSGNKEKKKKRSSAGLTGHAPPAADSSFFSEADSSIMNVTSITLPTVSGRDDSIQSTSPVLGYSPFGFVERKNRAASFDFCLSDKPQSDVVVHRRSLQPSTPTPNQSAESSFIENIFDSPGQRNRLHSMIEEKIYEAGSGSPQKFTGRVS
ncbi:uncharacterized protein CELE_F58A4.2 [Caenorhabditis elegans]|uniref:Uncharacterized protein F58A4.2 n=1 Tax=Caenorhabditis elegans TaxID=6239 RepID=YMH2_CAEEL|nr:Uncharacterized protein CELE_F58A4.2 [Caenorhabditis elegans]P34469.2 RecName: Full=Uncharacterized protein F58A4.2 [Caenorhabditis elegans]CAA80168.1 Uncharacterized protein CELE_F58A4.2 [Caenorhabditis elegans]|eukprot:NP_499124.1 Uncharacterized protein CELE_F58A4.2 [Caenorhabditis elegans]